MTASDPMTQRDFYAQTYDDSVDDWPGELAFYLGLDQEMGGDVLELAVRTGRIAIRLAQTGFTVTGLDRSAEMLEIGRQKTVPTPNMAWVEGDMRDFDLGRLFGLVIIPGHSFQNLLTADDQLACLRQVRSHLEPGGRFAVHLDHQDIDWLGTIAPGGGMAGVFEEAETITHPDTGRTVRASRAWTYRRSDQTASVTTRWQELDADGNVVSIVEDGPIPIHCIFRFEMEHLLGRAELAIDALYGDFFGNPLTEESSEMIFVARRPRN